MLKGLGKKAFHMLRQIGRMEGTPRQLAAGVAVGSAIGITPTLPFHTLIIACVTIPLRLNPLLAIIAGTIVSNPITFVPQYYTAWWIGNHFFPTTYTTEQILDLLHKIPKHSMHENMESFMLLGKQVVLALMSGGFLLSIVFACLGYCIGYWYFSGIYASSKTIPIHSDKRKSQSKT